MLLGTEKDSDPACAVLCLEATDSGWCIGVAATEEIPSVDGAVGPLKANKLKRQESPTFLNVRAISWFLSHMRDNQFATRS